MMKKKNDDEDDDGDDRSGDGQGVETCPVVTMTLG